MITCSVFQPAPLLSHNPMGTFQNGVPRSCFSSVILIFTTLCLFSALLTIITQFFLFLVSSMALLRAPQRLPPWASFSSLNPSSISAVTPLPTSFLLCLLYPSCRCKTRHHCNCLHPLPLRQGCWVLLGDRTHVSGLELLKIKWSPISAQSQHCLALLSCDSGKILLPFSCFPLNSIRLSFF